MDFQAAVASDLFQIEEKFIERNAHNAWRFRNHKSRLTQVAQAILTNVLTFLIR